ncbi:hypothetical protein PI2015_1700 [Pseudoalteromonas issachenkonii]|uniref:Uncharacterized protein n=1 Tax=Pseudoalteromonas issachenkonii TaxID=152297 RepID=A0ABM6N399_9GAMM|nr:hypothetical protein [Pseudoalteromonas issachenkonii]ALQ54994.1 hypothetical protein PI2015_1700 [Pseudoalteromonas issachenkonii]ATC90821.1 hypothetical protein PISS_a1953 [Pseudoalteromonas issachenkonii]
MKNNDTFNTIATLIFKHLYNNFPSPSQLDPEQLISDASDHQGEQIKGTISFLLHEEYIFSTPSATFLLTEKGFSHALCPKF